MKQVVIGGGGLAGLTCAYLLAKAGFEVKVIERKAYPFHRVCGEYISNEVVPFLKSHGLYPQAADIAQLTKFRLSSVSGKTIELPLDLGGFGVSRYYLDNFLAQRCKQVGVEILEKTSIKAVVFQEQQYKITFSNNTHIFSPLYIAAHGKSYGRESKGTAQQYIGVKHHIKLDFEPDVIELHNFEGGYCGISKVEGQTYNLCYLTSVSRLKRFGNIENMEAGLLHQNPHLKAIWRGAEFVFKAPLVINNFDFAPKRPVANDILMIGDAAGLITPLCGNGMALAIRSAELAARMVVRHYGNWPLLKTEYSRQWTKDFALRLWAGRNLQALFGRRWQSEFAVKIPRSLSMKLMSLTHGKPDMPLA